MRRSYRNPQKKSVLLRAPGLVIGALAFGAAGGSTLSDLLASWSASGDSGQACTIKGN
ncbi:succinoglycan biosynthesis protein exoi, partial [Rhizobium phaseoli]